MRNGFCILPNRLSVPPSCIAKPVSFGLCPNHSIHVYPKNSLQILVSHFITRNILLQSTNLSQREFFHSAPTHSVAPGPLPDHCCMAVIRASKLSAFGVFSAAVRLLSWWKLKPLHQNSAGLIVSHCKK